MDTVSSIRYRLRLAMVKLFDRLCRLPKWRTLNRLLEQLVDQRKDLFFVQIGANDGVIYDPIHAFVKRSNWRGVLVEPVPSYFHQLKENYRNNPRLAFANLAISSCEEMRDFYRIDDRVTYLPEWCKGLGTFNLDVLLSHKWAIPDLENYVVKEKVRCIAFKNLLDQYNIDKIDLLVIDTEGYDLEIIRQIDFDRSAPDILLYEHQYIKKQDRQNCEQTLAGYGYRFSSFLGNTLAYRPLG